MSSFSYKAKDRSGQTVTGTVEADSPSHAAALIRDMGRLPMDIRPAGVVAASVPRSAGGGSAFSRYIVQPLWTGVNIRALAFFYRQLATLLASGEPMKRFAVRLPPPAVATPAQALTSVSKEIQ